MRSKSKHAAGQGLEPRYRRSERRVLPLDDPANKKIQSLKHKIQNKFQKILIFKFKVLDFKHLNLF